MTGKCLTTLDEAKSSLGQWIQVDVDIEASLDWTEQDGWTLVYRCITSQEVVNIIQCNCSLT